MVVTSPPFDLTREKEYGNEKGAAYLDWITPFAREVFRILKPNGSFVVDLGGSWNAGVPTRNLYQFKFLIRLCDEIGFHLAQDFYWWNPSRLPTPAEWVTVRRIRVKDSVNTVWWFSKTQWPKALNTRVIQPYSESMTKLLKTGYTAKKRPSGHDISNKFSIDNGGAIPPNLIALPNTESNGAYQAYCKAQGLAAHPARFPVELPEYFIRFLTDPNDLVLDIFGGSCTTGQAAESLGRRWVCIDLDEKYLKGALGRFQVPIPERHRPNADSIRSYKIFSPEASWNGNHKFPPLPLDGGKKRAAKWVSGQVSRHTVVVRDGLIEPEFIEVT